MGFAGLIALKYGLRVEAGRLCIVPTYLGLFTKQIRKMDMKPSGLGCCPPTNMELLEAPLKGVVVRLDNGSHYACPIQFLQGPSAPCMLIIFDASMPAVPARHQLVWLRGLGLLLVQDI